MSSKMTLQKFKRVILRGSITENFQKSRSVHLPGLQASTGFAQAPLLTLLISSSPLSLFFFGFCLFVCFRAASTAYEVS